MKWTSTVTSTGHLGDTRKAEANAENRHMKAPQILQLLCEALQGSHKVGTADGILCEEGHQQRYQQVLFPLLGEIEKVLYAQVYQRCVTLTCMARQRSTQPA